MLKREGATISMDGRGRTLDNIFVDQLWRNVMYEDVYLKGYANMAELTVGLAQYFVFYNAQRPHHAMGYQTPSHVYSRGGGGGALIVDRLVAQFGTVASISRKGNFYDNAPMESFCGSLKNEMIHHQRYATRDNAESAIKEYIEIFHNLQRRHSRIGHLSPASLAENFSRETLTA